jgi:adenylate cyclase
VELQQFFSPQIVETIKLEDATKILEPDITNVTVMFCDIRGFSRRADAWRDDLKGLMQRWSEAIELMTQHILEMGGSISDFLGDAALGFWGWPVAPPDGPWPACQAALGIQRAFAEAREQPDHALAGFRVGIGIAHGQAIAGKIGSKLQSKIGVFGPVVNLGSRLEGLTKELLVPILIDEATAACVRKRGSSSARCRSLARIRPYGMETSLTVGQLLPPSSEFPQISDKNIRIYEKAMALFTKGKWPKALDVLGTLPVDDRAKDFLMTEIALHNYQPPPNWNGVLEMSHK